MSWTPGFGPQAINYAAIHTTLTASGSANTKGSYAQLTASTAVDFFGVIVEISAMAVAATNTNGLVDVAIGAAASEQIIIPDLTAGYTSTGGSVNGTPAALYYFPLYIPSGTRVAARLAAAIASDTCLIRLWGLTTPRSLPTFESQRVTAYGVVSASSRGTNVTPNASANTYGTAVSLAASTANPIRFMQMGVGGGGSTALGDTAGMAKIQLGSQLLLDRIRFNTNTSEIVHRPLVNNLLAQLEWDIPSGQDLQVAMMALVASSPAMDFIIYGMG